MRVLSVLFLLSGPLLVSAQNSFNIYTNASDIDPLPTNPRCAAALAADIECPAVIANILPSSSMSLPNVTAADLVQLCTPACYNSLMTTTAAVDSACTGWPFILGGTSYIASLPFRNLAYYWNLVRGVSPLLR
jgi:hypothetical protein